MPTETEEQTTVVEEEQKAEPESSIAEALKDAHKEAPSGEDKVESDTQGETTEAATETAAPLTAEQMDQRETDYAAKVKEFEEREARHNQDRDAYMEYRDRLDGRDPQTADAPQQPAWVALQPDTENEKLLHAGLKELHESRQQDRTELDYYRDTLHKERVKHAAVEVAAAKEELQKRFPDIVEKKWERVEKLTIDLIKAAQERGEDYSITELLTHNIQGLAQPGSAERARTEVHKIAGKTAKARMPAGGESSQKGGGTMEEELRAAYRRKGTG